MSSRNELLLTQLRRYEPFDGLEDSHRQAMVKLLTDGADPDLEATAMFDLDIHAIPAGKGEPDHHHFDVPGPESQRAIAKIERLLTGGFC